MPSIEFENVDLCYPVKAHRRTTLKDFFFHRLLGRTPPRLDEVKALDRIDLKVEGGECAGIIGKNGAGKSTLLRAIAGVYPIAAGRRHVDGTVCSLFDIAAGFEWNATGWENIRLRALLQGETYRTLAGKLRRVADFTNLGPTLDIPLRCYSTGQIMLLSFAIAAACEPEILLIDEFLSAGDIHFREKAIAEIVTMIRQGRIVMVAGHDLPFLRQFCTRVVWLEQGSVHADGPTEHVIESYLASRPLNADFVTLVA